MQVEVFFLGEPRILIDKEEKVLGKKKLEALLFYLLFHERMDRNEIASIFWPSFELTRGKSSLRNSLYEIRRTFGVDLFAASNRDKVILSKDIILYKDVDLLVDSSPKSSALEYSSPVFMQNRELKNNPGYETWLLSMRQAYQSILVGNLRALLQVAVTSGQGQEVIGIARDILEMEPYDELTLRKLMQHCAEHSQYNDALACFLKMKQVLKEDLAVEPELETLKLADFIQRRKQQSELKPDSSPGDNQHLLILFDEYSGFLEGSHHHHVLVHGELGSGRSTLIHSFLETNPHPTWTIHLDFSNKFIPGGFLLKWSNQLKGRPQEDFRQLLNNLPAEPLVCVIENLEFIDEESLSYLTGFLSEPQNRVFFVLKVTLEFMTRNDFIQYLIHHEVLIGIRIPSLTERDLSDALCRTLQQIKSPLQGNEVRAAYEYSRGNLLLATEYFRPTGRMQKLFFSLTVGLPPAEKKLLQDCSVYPKGFTVAMARMVAKDQTGLIDCLKELVIKRLLVEDGELLHVKYPPFRQWLFDQQPQFYQICLHEKAANHPVLPHVSRRKEARMRAWHWKMAHHIENYLIHQLLLLELTLNFYDQMYPSDLEADDLPDHLDERRLEQYALLEEVAREVEEYSQTHPGPQSARMQLTTGYLMGRRMIAGGRQEEGVRLIDKMIAEAEEAEDTEYLLKGIIERIHYGIQKDDREIMGEYIEKADGLIQQMEWGEDQQKQAEVLRLAGLYEFNRKRYDKALVRLNEADAILRSPRYARNGFLARAGTLNYIGRTLEAMGEMQGADKAFLASIQLVEGRLHKCLDILYAEYGRFLWSQGHFEKAKRILGQALQEYQILGTHWKRPTTEAVLGLISLKQGNLKAAHSHLVNAQIYHKADRRLGEETLIEQLAMGVREFNSAKK